MSKASDLYASNLKLYNKLSSTKTTIPTLEQLKEKQLKNIILKKRLSNYHITNVKNSPSHTQINYNNTDEFNQ